MRYYIYALVDSLKRPFYIGKTNNPSRRKKRHIYDATKYSFNYPVHNKIRKILREGLSLDIEIIEDDLAENIVDEREQYWIKEYRKNHSISNIANGGEGGKGTTKETIEKIRQHNTGQKRTEEAKTKMSNARKGIKFTEEHKKNLSKARKKRITKKETKEKCSKTSKGKINIKKYKLIDPQGVVYYTEKGLSDFCRNHQLTPANLMKVLSGKRKHHKGWRIEQCQS